MAFTDVVSMLGAVALFLFGMSTMSQGLEQLSNGRLEQALEKLTSNVFKGVLLGAVVTGLIQSSGATTVMCVGFVNAGIMKLEQTVGIIMGANIGTTVTAQILRLTSISGEGNPVLTLLKPSVMGPVLALVGVVLFLFLNGGKKKNVGQILLGLGVLFMGMNTMTTAVAPLQDLPQFRTLFTAFSNPILGVIVGAAVTALLQSSSASMGILQAISTTGAVTFNIAIPLIMGQNIGSTVTALISSVGASKNAKRTALIHVFFNIIGSAFFLVVFYALNAAFRLPFWTSVMDMGSIANLHLAFNLACTALLLPFRKVLVKLVEKLVPGQAELPDASSMLDQRFLSTPSLALDQAHEVVIRMGTYAQENYRSCVRQLHAFDPKAMERISETEAALDKMENALDNYLMKLSDAPLSPQDSAHITELLHVLSDFERIGDYSINLAECAEAMSKDGIAFTPSAQKELDAITGAVDEAIDKALDCYKTRSYDLALKVEPIEEVVDLMRDALREHHIERLKSGKCTIEQGTQFLELLVGLERISDHCSNIALRVLRQTAPKGDLVRTDTHAYTHELHHGHDPQFEALFDACKAKYYGPIENELH